MKKRLLTITAVCLSVVCLFALVACDGTTPPVGGQTYVVTFDSVGGSSVGSVSVEEGQPVTAPASPTKQGYTFDGWYTDGNYSTKWNFDSVVTSNMTLYAKWQEDAVSNTYVVTFDSVGGSAVSSQSVEEGNKAVAPTDPTKQGYTFDGWYTSDDYATAWDFNNGVSASFTLYAKWQEVAVESNVVYNLGYEQDGDPVIVEKETQNGYVDLFTPTRAGFVFNGWWISGRRGPNNEVILTSKWSATQRVDGRTVYLYAEWVEESQRSNALTAPSVSVGDNDLFSWEPVENAEDYQVVVLDRYNNEVFKQMTDGGTSYSFSAYEKGRYIVKIRAIGDGVNYANSPYVGKTIYYRQIGYIANLAYDDNAQRLTWDQAYGAEYYEVYVNNNMFGSSTTNTDFSLLGLDAGAYTITVYAKANGWDNADARINIIQLKLLAPQVDVAFDADNNQYVVSWTSVQNADCYKVYKDGELLDTVYATQYAVSNDGFTRQNPSAVISVTSFNSDRDYLQSVGAEVTIGHRANVSFEGTTTGLQGDGEYVFGTEVTVITPIDNTYVFFGWFVGDEKKSDEYEYTFTMPYDDVVLDARWGDDPALQLFEYQRNDDGYVITGIVDPTVTNITIPNCVISIDDYAFDSCGNLTSIIILDSVTSIGDYAFKGCSNLTNATVPGFVIAALPKSNLQTVVITSGTSIDDNAFFGCSNLTSITIPDSVTSIGDSAFKGCSNLTSITIPDGVTSIGDYAFYGCSNLTSITIPDSVTSISGSAFGGCSGLTYNEYGNAYYLGNATNPYVVLIKADDMASAFQINSNTKLICTKAFQYYSGLTSITIPNSVTSIGNYAFDHCYDLSSVIISDGTTSIGNYAFSDCSCLASVTIPDSVTIVGRGAFDGCSNLSYNEYDNAYYLGNEINPYVVLIKAKDTSITSCEINDNTKVIYDDAFFECSELTSIVIHDGITSIGRRAFSDCSNLTSVVIGTGVISIGAYAFSDCSNLTSLTIASGVVSISISEFYGCNNLTNVTAPGFVIAALPKSKLQTVVITSGTSIGNEAFRNCNNLTSITIPDGVTSIGDYAFYGCNNLTSITIPDGVTSIGDYAFYGCSNLGGIIIPRGVTSIGDHAFRGCSNMSGITIPRGVTSIGDFAFYDCSLLITIIIPDGVTRIGHRTFYGCSNLTSITISDTVTRIGEYAFYNCSILATIRYTGTKVQWRAISKDNGWKMNSGEFKVYCTDGNWSKNNA